MASTPSWIARRAAAATRPAVPGAPLGAVAPKVAGGTGMGVGTGASRLQAAVDTRRPERTLRNWVRAQG